MTRLFVRVYLGVLLALLVGMVASWAIVRVGYDRELLDDDGIYIELIHPRIVSDLAKAPRERWPEILEWWQGVSEHTVVVLGRDDPFWASQQHLVQPPGDELAIEIYTDTRWDYVWAARAIPGTDELIYYTYAAESSLGYMIATVLGNVIIFTTLAGAVYFLLRPIIRSTEDLTSTAQSYAEGHLDARVNVKGTGLLARLSRQFNRMAEEIQHRIHEQEVMTTAISHELRTPLTRLRLALDMALANEDDTKLRDMLAEMDDDLDDLDELTGELLTLAKLTYTGESLELRPVKLREIFERLIPKMSGLESRVEFVLEGQLDAQCMGHEEHLSRAFSNLLVNGQRYAHSTVAVSFAVEDEAVFVRVDDDGDGIPAGRRKEVFIPFARLDRSRARYTGGFGLGLAIVKQSLEVQGASIHLFESEMGGAQFVVRLAKA